jgi:hypothetical protein
MNCHKDIKSLNYDNSKVIDAKAKKIQNKNILSSIFEDIRKYESEFYKCYSWRKKTNVIYETFYPISDMEKYREPTIHEFFKLSFDEFENLGIEYCTKRRESIKNFITEAHRRYNDFLVKGYTVEKGCGRKYDNCSKVTFDSPWSAVRCGCSCKVYLSIPDDVDWFNDFNMNRITPICRVERG